MPGLEFGSRDDSARDSVRDLPTHTSGPYDCARRHPPPDPAVTGGAGPSAPSRSPPAPPAGAVRPAVAPRPVTRPGSDAYSGTIHALLRPVVQRVGRHVRAAATRDGPHVLTIRFRHDAPPAPAGERNCRTRSPAAPAGRRPALRQIGTMSGAPSRAASAVWSSGCRCDSRSASTRLR
ncbi:hypothetical protein QFZ58_002965 [Streptomyces sp. B1I3]|nr:hypothetical protein [Streptomyces sp. B1I3]